MTSPIVVQGVVAVDAIDTSRPPYNVRSDRTAAQNSAGLITAFADSTATGKSVLLPPGTIPVEPGLAWADTGAALRGRGTERTRLAFVDNTENGLKVGATGRGGLISDFTVAGPTTSLGGLAKTNKAALVIDGARHTSIERVTAEHFDIGFDFINNCYGSYGLALSAPFARCNVGLNLRTGGQSGSDLPFYNCWLSGAHAATYIAGDGGGYGFFGGQMGGGFQANDAFDACAVLGKDYETGTTAGVGTVAFNSMDFEGWADGWAFHSYAETNVAVQSLGFNASVTTPGHKAAGILLAENASSSKWEFTNCGIHGYFSQTALLSVSGAGSQFMLDERGWQASTPAEVAGVAQAGGAKWMRGLLQQANSSLGVATFREGSAAQILLGGLRLRNTAGILERSTDGTTWSAV